MVKNIFLNFIFLCLIGLNSYAQKVSNINIRQEQSNIIISYDLETKTPCKVSLYVSTNGGSNWQGPLKKVSSDIGNKVVSGKHNITWNVLEEFEELTGNNVKFQVKAEELRTKSIVSINKELLKNPRDAKLYKLRGDLKHEKGDWDGAISDYSKAILLNPKYADAYIARAESKPVDFDAQISDYSKAISLNPNDASTYFKRGFSKFRLEDYNGALSDYNIALELEPNNTKFIFEKSRVKRDLKDIKGSIDDINKVIELDSLYKDVYYMRGIYKLILNDTEGANVDFEKHIKASTNPIYEEYQRIGNSRWYTKDYKTAITYFTKSIEFYEKLYSKESDTALVASTSYLGRAFSRYKLNDIKGANSDFEKFIEKSNDKAKANSAIAIGFPYSFEEFDDFQNSIKYLTRAIDLNPNDASKYSSRASRREELKDVKGAIEDYTKAIELDPNYADYYDNIADLKIELEDYKGAILDYNKAILISPNESYLYNSRGLCKFNINNYIGAITDYSKAIQLNPKDGNSYLNRGRLKILTKDKKGGCKDLNKAGELGEDDAYRDINESCN